MKTDRPCICGCMFDGHAEIKFKDGKEAIYYCRLHTTKPGFWCVTYTPLSNLQWLELKSKEDEKQQAL